MTRRPRAKQLAHEDANMDQDSPREQPALAVVGASAGGLEAVSILVSALPADFPAAVVIAQHIGSRSTSHLPEILARRSLLPVHLISHGQLLQPGHIYVAPSGSNIGIMHNQLTLSAQGGTHPTPSVDDLFNAAAEAYGDNVIGVILSGTGSDGAEGARAIKAAGGAIVVQNPRTAQYPSMPQSVDTGIVDLTCNIEEMGQALASLVAGVRFESNAHDPQTLQVLLADVRTHSGMDFAGYKTPTILRRLHRRMAITGCPTLESYADYLREHTDEYHLLAASFLIKVTEFLRDAELFEWLREHVLPELIATAAKTSGSLRIWSAGCATGEEAYSLAIIVSEALRRVPQELDVRIFATDVDADAIAFARRGSYSRASVAHLDPALISRYFDPALISRYFDPALDRYTVKKNLRALTIFGEHDLTRRAAFPRIDLILCRNVLMYFSPDWQKRLLQVLAFSLRDGGFLVLGKAETAAPAAEFFEPTSPLLKIFARRGGRVTFPLGMPAPPSSASSSRRATSIGAGDLNRRQARSDRMASELARWRSLVGGLPVGIATVDQRYGLLSINRAARRLFGIHGNAIGDDLLHRVANLSPTLRAGIDAAFKGRPSAMVIELASELKTAPARVLQIRCELLPKAADELAGTVTLAVTDVTELADERLKRLQEAYDKLELANEHLTDRNAELGAAAEELTFKLEESQVSTEEVETLNEEIQASNEELETLNEELQSANEELNTVNQDLHVRDDELQAMTTSLQAQRGLQDEFLAMASHELRTPVATLSLGITQLMRQTGQEPTRTLSSPEVVTSMGRLQRQTQRLNVLVGDLIDAARLQSGKIQLDLQPIDIRIVVMEAVAAAKAMIADPVIHFEIDSALANPAMVNGDAVRLDQVMMNLLLNAAAHAPDSDRVNVLLRPADGEVEIQVQDFGKGIPQNSLDKVFERFYQGSGRTESRVGLGLGLYISKGIVDAHGGSIEVASVEGEGATFAVRLPLLP